MQEGNRSCLYQDLFTYKLIPDIQNNLNQIKDNIESCTLRSSDFCNGSEMSKMSLQPGSCWPGWAAWAWKAAGAIKAVVISRDAAGLVWFSIRFCLGTFERRAQDDRWSTRKILSAEVEVVSCSSPKIRAGSRWLFSHQIFLCCVFSYTLRCFVIDDLIYCMFCVYFTHFLVNKIENKLNSRICKGFVVWDVPYPFYSWLVSKFIEQEILKIWRSGMFRSVNDRLPVREPRHECECWRQFRLKTLTVLC